MAFRNKLIDLLQNSKTKKNKQIAKEVSKLAREFNFDLSSEAVGFILKQGNNCTQNVYDIIEAL